MNKEIFSIVFNKSKLNTIIFNHVNEINDRYKGDVYSWLGVIRSPKMMITYGYFDELKQYYQQNINHILYHSDDFMYDQENAFMTTIEVGRFDIFIYMWDFFKLTQRYSFLFDIERILSKVGKEAIIHDRMDFIRFVLESVDSIRSSLMNHELIGKLLEISPKSHNLEMVQYIAKIYKQRLPAHHKIDKDSCRVLNTVAFVGRLDMFNWAIANEFDEFRVKRLLRESAQGGNIEFFQYLMVHYPRKLDSHHFQKFMVCAASADSLELMKILHNQYHVEIDTINLLTIAVDNNNLEISKWVFENGPKINTRVYDIVLKCQTVKNNNLEMVKWLTEHVKLSCSTETMDLAAKLNRLDILEYLHRNSSEKCSLNAMGFAAKKGHINIVRWLNENRTEGCNNVAMDFAAKNGHVHILKWFKENRTERCTQLAFDIAGSLEVMKWIHQNQTDLQITESNAIDRAAKYGNLDAMKWILENYGSKRCPDTSMSNALEKNQFNIVGWLLMNREGFKDFDVNDKLFVNLLEYDHSIAQWILENRDIPRYKIVKYQTILEDDLPKSLKSLEFLDKYIAIKQQESLKKRKYGI
ncbi:hypothetical protein PPL_10024 [Heterostelium album PN500]|uniref:Ankyrin repeat protein n=1 Tax=Heterostelium pallidum (strain ATCC 26659 / Pp 5 / PN500) TaxID=670386 RepID=D3BPY0_HETP5|nr:hypothetical protein PPL_10024 [Heterostelium album PN500]EFA76263.1 hypothetical protein PPL_10024 [Heterostelium album PN500]|eukprot:XP_020428396.1 hypothetical protein PPL_10024 [Heterostelium album PN500]